MTKPFTMPDRSEVERKRVERDGHRDFVFTGELDGCDVEEVE